MSGSRLLTPNAAVKAVSFVLLLAISVSVASCVPYPWDMPRRTLDLGFLGFPLFIIGLGVYFIPTIVGAARRTRSLVGIVLLNIFLGWTFVGWIGALVWSLVGARNR